MKVEHRKGELIQPSSPPTRTSGEHKTNVMLLFPPDWHPSEPYLSLPTLTCVLRAAGYRVIQKDVNLEMYDWYFSGDFLRRVVLRRVPEQLDRLRRITRIQELTGLWEDPQMALSALTAGRIAELTEKAERAKCIVRSEEFYDSAKLEWALTTFREVMEKISLVYAPARICMFPAETDLTYRLSSSAEILKAVEDVQVNVYRDVFEHVVKPAIEAEAPDVIGISIVQQQQLYSTMTFCALIKRHFPGIHVTIGGNTVTRLRDVLPNLPLFALFDSAVIHEGESAFLQLVEAVVDGRALEGVPNLIYRDASGIHRSSLTCAEDMSLLPPPDFDGLPLEKYFVPDRILPYLATRGCYWGRCSFCDHGEGYTSGYRTKKIDKVIGEIRYLKMKYGCRHFHFTDESYPPALFRKLTRKLIETNMDIVWTAHMRFEKSLSSDERVWKDARESGCKFLHCGCESGNERVLRLMDKATTKEVMRINLRRSADVGIWNHCMNFFGFPGETREEAYDSILFLEENRNIVHSVGSGTFVLGKHTPVARNPEEFGVTLHINPDSDLELDYYYTVKEGLSVEEAAQVFEEFNNNHYPGWDLTIPIREYIFLYIAHFGTTQLPQLSALKRICFAP